MEERKIVKEMFDGLFNIVTGPGFYTVEGAKKKKPGSRKPGSRKQDLTDTNIDTEIQTDSCSAVSVEKSESISINDQHHSHINISESDNITGYEQSGHRDAFESIDSGSIVDDTARKTCRKSDTSHDSDNTDCDMKADKHSSLNKKHNSRRGSEENDVQLSLKCASLSQVKRQNELKYQDCNRNVKASVVCPENPDLVVSTRRVKKKPVLDVEVSSDKLVPDDEENEDNPSSDLVSQAPIDAMKDIDRQSDISTDSRASGYSKSRSVVLRKSPRNKTTKKCKLEKVKQPTEKPKKEAKSLKRSTKRKLESDIEEHGPRAPKKAKISRNISGRKSASKTSENKCKSKSKISRKPVRKKVETNSTKIRNSRSQERLKKTKGKKQTYSGSKKVVSRQVAKPEKRTIKHSKEKRKGNAIEKIPTGKKKTPRKDSAKSKLKHTVSQNPSRKAKLCNCKQKSGKMSTRERTLAENRQKSINNSNNSILNKQQKILEEHSKQAVPVEEINIISALCKLEDKSKTLHSKDLEDIMPMKDTASADHKRAFGVGSYVKDNHPGGVWKKLVLEN